MQSVLQPQRGVVSLALPSIHMQQKPGQHNHAADHAELTDVSISLAPGDITCTSQVDNLLTLSPAVQLACDFEDSKSCSLTDPIPTFNSEPASKVVRPYRLGPSRLMSKRSCTSLSEAITHGMDASPGPLNPSTVKCIWNEESFPQDPGGDTVQPHSFLQGDHEVWDINFCTTSAAPVQPQMQMEALAEQLLEMMGPRTELDTSTCLAVLQAKGGDLGSSLEALLEMMGSGSNHEVQEVPEAWGSGLLSYHYTAGVKEDESPLNMQCDQGSAQALNHCQASAESSLMPCLEDAVDHVAIVLPAERKSQEADTQLHHSFSREGEVPALLPDRQEYCTIFSGTDTDGAVFTASSTQRGTELPRADSAAHEKVEELRIYFTTSMFSDVELRSTLQACQGDVMTAVDVLMGIHEQETLELAAITHADAELAQKLMAEEKAVEALLHYFQDEPENGVSGTEFAAGYKGDTLTSKIYSYDEDEEECMDLVSNRGSVLNGNFDEGTSGAGASRREGHACSEYWEASNLNQETQHKQATSRRTGSKSSVLNFRGGAEGIMRGLQQDNVSADNPRNVLRLGILKKLFGADASVEVLQDALLNCGGDVEKARDALLDMGMVQQSLDVTIISDALHSSLSSYSDVQSSLRLATAATYLPGSGEPLVSQHATPPESKVSTAGQSADHDRDNFDSSREDLNEEELLDSDQPLTSEQMQMMYQRCRQKAQKWTLQRDGLQAQAQEARSHGDVKLARELDALVRTLKQLIIQEHSRAAARLFQYRNRHIVNRWEIDLHALHVNEALKEVGDHVTRLRAMASKVILKVITGRGNHSNGDPKVLPAVREWLIESGLPFYEGVGYYEIELSPNAAG
ncbi:hypothetical protein CEUSTIGMA_g4719.t1 [Chlamydomonas eustigma]|uniref:Smr domain-containing protein n=1 Tax=Chlamydomonas eustigma TaxID=1157962 RepID=A0A250X2F7_9CHLO|nr:hypothetical protein CEUSTIGMA_g4719.t1 [Chlamydomonas eustigma]|eukprot:GAX77273.1 hypothetical protein CEUSTIGMA_g4719.t1 [Chlamydomonas eustigma]